ncbi:CRISPR-associated helicase Cas3' [Bowmanella pacifica]|uniref:CRISPR-associated helicase/endonuclease Cas3 n=1 Tax=Bowmanella pacifica TaxID=502051 RepID=A0A918DIX1_9ALTE|nr:CRISPR-associated helicase Cas3' [Bowmanella pacifica]GGO67563.1 CRISPR-associated helicase/endonuclease Cas3 [Bowmanella pacifica]
MISADIKSHSDSIYRYWGKANASAEDVPQYHLLPYHCLDVAAVGHRLLSQQSRLAQDIAEFLQIDTDQLRQMFVFALLLHDLGKFAAAFQGLKQFPDSPLISYENCPPYDAKNARHDMLGAVLLFQLFERRLLDLEQDLALADDDDSEDFLFLLLDISMGHHGKPIQRSTDKVEQKRFFQSYCREKDLLAAADFIKQVYCLIPVNWPTELLYQRDWLDRFKQISWQLAGMAVLSDWLGSDSSIFNYQDSPESLADYWISALSRAEQAVAKTELFKPLAINGFDSVAQQFGFSPSPLQRWAELVVIDGPGQLFILEDVTGAGKTEAALALTHRMMALGHADGFYFGLPTMATSNAMYKRVANHYRKMYRKEGAAAPSLVLAHGANKMDEEYQASIGEPELVPYHLDDNYAREDESTSSFCNQWLADSRKKALLAPVGVGTIDQALLAILPRKHQVLRLLGLHRKVLIFDEVHSADSYMLELLDDLLQMHLRQGGSAILLSATLSTMQRSKLCQSWQQAAHIAQPQIPQNFNFPLTTHVSANGYFNETEMNSRPEVSRELAVEFVHSEADCVDLLVNAAQENQCVVWVRNSVKDALRAYEAVVEQLGTEENVLLFHSRFVLGDRKRIEDKVLAIFGKASMAKDRAGKILICTQVFQESLDADADLMISDLCPIDDLIQRAGRLHRHTRNAQRQYQAGITEHRPAPLLLVHCPEWQDEPKVDWLSRQFRDTEAVYRSPGKLWLGLRILRELGAIRMPLQARQLIEAVYGENAREQIPDSLTDKHLLAVSKDRQMQGAANQQKIQWELGYNQASAIHWFDDSIEISTRFSDLEYVEVLVLRSTNAGSLEPLIGDTKYPVALSTVKLEKRKTADCLAIIPEHLEAQVRALSERFPAIKFLQCWLPELDSNFSYCSQKGVVKMQNEEVQ